jgi:hypothetical protein
MVGAYTGSNCSTQAKEMSIAEQIKEYKSAEGYKY